MNEAPLKIVSRAFGVGLLSVAFTVITGVIVVKLAKHLEKKKKK